MSRSLVVRIIVCATIACVAAVTFVDARQLASRPPDAQIRALEMPARVASQKVEDVLSRLELTPGLIVADIGAGTGVFSRPIARAVAPTGKVYAVDIVPELLAYLDGRAQGEQLTNITTVLGLPDDPKLPAHDADIALFNDVLHHIEHRQQYLMTLAAQMKPDSLMAIVEFDNRGDRSRLIEGVPMIDRAELDGWLVAVGYRPVQVHTDLFPNKWYVIYARGTAGERLRRAAAPS